MKLKVENSSEHAARYENRIMVASSKYIGLVVHSINQRNRYLATLHMVAAQALLTQNYYEITTDTDDENHFQV